MTQIVAAPVRQRSEARGDRRGSQSVRVKEREDEGAGGAGGGRGGARAGRFSAVDPAAFVGAVFPPRWFALREVVAGDGRTDGRTDGASTAQSGVAAEHRSPLYDYGPYRVEDGRQPFHSLGG